MDRRNKSDYIPPMYFLFEELNAFMNRLQITGDQFFPEISWKQWFLLVEISLFESPPTIGELADVTGSSHQNVKQIILKLETAGFVELFADEMDKKKLRVSATGKIRELYSNYQLSCSAIIKSFCQGISEEDIAVTQKTISVMDRNLAEIRGKQANG